MDHSILMCSDQIHTSNCANVMFYAHLLFAKCHRLLPLFHLTCTVHTHLTPNMCTVARRDFSNGISGKSGNSANYNMTKNQKICALSLGFTTLKHYQ